MLKCEKFDIEAIESSGITDDSQQNRCVNHSVGMRQGN